MNHARPRSLARRKFLKGAGVGLALPLLDAFLPRARAGAELAESPSGKKMVCICTSLGIHAPFLFPGETGSEYAPTPYLELLDQHRRDFTLFSGLSHPDQDRCQRPHLGDDLVDLRQVPRPGRIQEHDFARPAGGGEHRAADAAAIAGVGDWQPEPVLQPWRRHDPRREPASQVFAKLFLEGTPAEVRRQVQRLREGQSIMDTVQEEARSFASRVGSADREKLDEYFTSVRELEQRLVTSEAWVQKPKPKVDAEPPRDIQNGSDLIGRMRLLFDLIPLALQTDSTRLITIFLQGANAVPPVPGVTIDHHNLSHHGQEPEKIAQLRLIETEQFRVFSGLLDKLKAKREAGAPLLDDTMVLFGSNLGNANSHDTRNLPILLAGGGFKLGQHTAFDANNNARLCNLYVSMLQQLGIDTDRFGSSTGTLSGLAPA